LYEKGGKKSLTMLEKQGEKREKESDYPIVHSYSHS
jgi:hypothetical protein